MNFALIFFREFHFSFNFQGVAALLLRSAGAVAVAPPVVGGGGAVSAPGGAGGTPKKKCGVFVPTDGHCVAQN